MSSNTTSNPNSNQAAKDFWTIIAEQERKYGNVNTPEINWGEDIGAEKIE